jgi:ferredoxin-NADP reductase
MSGQNVALARPLPARRATGGTPVANATLVGRDDLTDQVARFRVRPDDGPRPFVPGQYFSLGLSVDGSLVQRPYSNAAVGGAAELEFLIRRVPGGRFTPALWATPVGTPVSLGRATGVFTLLPDDDRTHLFIATGTGLAPFLAMVGALGGRRHPPRAVVVHGVAHVAELAYRDRLTVLQAGGCVRYIPTISRPAEAQNAAWDGATGHATRVLPGLFEGLRDTGTGRLDPGATVAYLCGNPGMIESASAVLAGRGFPPEAIVTERYWAEPPA